MQSGKPKLLVIEDVHATRRVLDVSLRSYYEVLMSPDGLHGLDSALTDKPDLVILDLGLPKMDGWQVFDELRKREQTRDIPIIVLTAHVVDHEHWAGRLGEGDAFMAKPFLPDDLRHRIEHLLERAAAVKAP